MFRIFTCFREAHFLPIQRQTVLYPFVLIFHWKLSLTSALLCVKEEHKASLQDILRYSPFKTQEELLHEIDAITYPCSSGKKTGTRIIIWNLHRSVCIPHIQRCMFYCRSQWLRCNSTMLRSATSQNPTLYNDQMKNVSTPYLLTIQLSGQTHKTVLSTNSRKVVNTGYQ